MEQKHPVGAPIVISDEEITTPSISFTTGQIKKAIHSFKKGTSPGPDGWRPEHFKESLAALAQNRSSRLLTMLVSLVNVLAGGKLPKEVVPYFAGGNLFAAIKKYVFSVQLLLVIH